MNQRSLFLRHIAQTSPAPLAIEIAKAEGCKLYDVSGKEYIDLIGGISVANTGHRHPDVIAAIKNQLDAYLHVMVYGEFVESPQVKYAKALSDSLPGSLHSVYFTNSGAEAVEGAMKLAKKITGRTRILAFENSYHGSTQGALSIIGDEYWRNAFRPLLPNIGHLKYGSDESLNEITNDVACVVIEAIQAEAGVKAADKKWLKAVRKKCTDVGALFILDEIQTGFGRTGKLWAFEHFEIIPDVLLLGKALGGGMPLGAFISSKENMDAFTDNPVLGHISTFAGHPVCCAAGHAAFEVLLKEKLIDGVEKRQQLFLELLKNPKIKAVRSFGLWLALDFESFEVNKKVIDACIAKGVLTDWFLFASNSLRISPPLSISEEEIKKACSVILEAIELSL